MGVQDEPSSGHAVMNRTVSHDTVPVHTAMNQTVSDQMVSHDTVWFEHGGRARRLVVGVRQAADDALGPARRATRRLRLAEHRLASAPNPRQRSLVTHHLEHPVDAVVETLTNAADHQLRSGRTILRLDGVAPIHRDDRVVVVPATLRVPLSRPDLAVWLRVEPWWSSRSLVSLSLRTTRRWRYTRRYFASAHAVLTELDRALGCAA